MIPEIPRSKSMLQIIPHIAIFRKKKSIVVADLNITLKVIPSSLTLPQLSYDF